jgi:hypothetical protein
MSSRKLDRIVFHSKEDGSAGYYLEKADSLLNDLDIACVIKINDLLEIHHIKLYFDNELFLIKWDEKTKNNFKIKIYQVWVNIRAFYQTITDDNLMDYVNELEFDYKESFWQLFNWFQSYKRIQKSKFSVILEKHPHHIRHILPHKELVNNFDDEIRTFLIEYSKTAELILSNFEQHESPRQNKFNFPKCLSLKDKEDIISKYIDSEDANLNYIRPLPKSSNKNEKLLGSLVPF